MSTEHHQNRSSALILKIEVSLRLNIKQKINIQLLEISQQHVPVLHGGDVIEKLCLLMQKFAGKEPLIFFLGLPKGVGKGRYGTKGKGAISKDDP